MIATLLALTLAPLAHLVGDYVLQSQTMATRKLVSWAWACCHASVYSLPFYLLLQALSAHRALAAWAIIFGTHAVIDRLALGKAWCVWYGVGHPGLWHDEARDGAFVPPPAPIAMWLPILVDNTFHLLINAAAVALAVYPA